MSRGVRSRIGVRVTRACSNSELALIVLGHAAQMVRIKPPRGEEQVVDRVCNVDRGLVLCPTIDLVCAKVLADSAPGLTDKIEDLADRCLVAAVCAAEVELDGLGRRNGG